MKRKNPEIHKPPFVLADLPAFNLGVNDVGRAAIDFLRLDHRVKLNDWVAAQLMPPSLRVSRGRTIPITNLSYPSNNVVIGTIHLAGCEVDLKGLRDRCDLKEGDFVRVSPCSDTGDLGRGQTIKQLTSGVGHNGYIERIDWQRGEVEIRVIPSYQGATFYILQSRNVRPTDPPLALKRLTRASQITSQGAWSASSRGGRYARARVARPPQTGHPSSCSPASRPADALRGRPYPTGGRSRKRTEAVA